MPPFNGVRRLPRGEEAMKEEAGEDLRLVFNTRARSGSPSSN